MIVNILQNRHRDRFVLICDFCGATQHEVKLLIASPNGNHICKDCVDVCVTIAEAQESTP